MIDANDTALHVCPALSSEPVSAPAMLALRSVASPARAPNSSMAFSVAIAPSWPGQSR